jgi:hypothetical protein
MQYDALLFRNTNISPEQQYALTKVKPRVLRPVASFKR